MVNGHGPLSMVNGQSANGFNLLKQLKSQHETISLLYNGGNVMKQINIDIIYNELIEKLNVSNNGYIITDLENSAAGAATGSEALMHQGSYLISLKHSNPAVFKLIEEQIREYLKYCKQNGLIIR